MHTPATANTPAAGPLVAFGTQVSLDVRRNQIFHNGYADESVRRGTGLFVHLEQGTLIGAATPNPLGPPTTILDNDIYQNFMHGIELRGQATAAGTQYGIAFDGVIANNVVDRNGSPTMPGLAVASNELLFSLQGPGLAAGFFATTTTQITQNTVYDGPEYPLVQFIATDNALNPTPAASFAALGFRGNLGAQSDPVGVGAPAFAGFNPAFSTGIVPSGAAIAGNTGYFDVANVAGAFLNASTQAVDNFNANAGGHYVSPMVRDYRLIAFSSGVANPAIDRVLNGSVLTPGQQLADKGGLPRIFNHPTIFLAFAVDSDSGAHENQGQ